MFEAFLVLCHCGFNAIGGWMFCSKCGTGNRDGATFCVSCGAALTSTNTTVSQSSESVPNQGSRSDSSTSEVHGGHTNAPESDIAERDDDVHGETGDDPSNSEGQHREAYEHIPRWRRAVGWVLVVFGIGVALIALYGLVVAQGGISTTVANVTGRQSGSESGQADAASLQDVIFAPNVIGLEKVVAMDRLEAVGIGTDKISITTRPSAVGSQIVMDQVPRPGEIVVGSVDIVLAEPIVVMPDVVGLNADLASIVLQEAGIGAELVSLSERPYVAEPQLVLEQVPRAGSESPRSVALTVAGDALAPDVAGLSADAALVVFEELGAEVTLTPVQVLNVSPQTVVRQSVAPGTVVSGAVDIGFAVEPPSTTLADLGGEDWDRCYLDTVEVDETPYPDTVYCSSLEERDAWIIYRLDRSFEQLRMTLSILDDSSTDRAVVVIEGDGALAERYNLSRGTDTMVDLPVGTYTTLKIIVRGIAEAQVGLLDARAFEQATGSP